MITLCVLHCIQYLGTPCIKRMYQSCSEVAVMLHNCSNHLYFTFFLINVIVLWACLQTTQDLHRTSMTKLLVFFVSSCLAILVTSSPHYGWVYSPYHSHNHVRWGYRPYVSYRSPALGYHPHLNFNIQRWGYNVHPYYQMMHSKTATKEARVVETSMYV